MIDKKRLHVLAERKEDRKLAPIRKVLRYMEVSLKNTVDAVRVGDVKRMRSYATDVQDDARALAKAILTLMMKEGVEGTKSGLCTAYGFSAEAKYTCDSWYPAGPRMEGQEDSPEYRPADVLMSCGNCRMFRDDAGMVIPG